MAEQKQKWTDQKDRQKGRDSLKDHTTPTGVKEGYNNSEHELEVSGMRHAPEDRDRRRESYSKADIDEDVVVSQTSVNAMSPMEKRQEDEVEGGHLLRTPESKSLHDELDHTERKENRQGPTG